MGYTCDHCGKTFTYKNRFRHNKTCVPTEEAFWSRVNTTDPDGCWEYMGERDRKGYGRFSIQRQGKRFRWAAHRLSVQLERGPIPEGLEVDHVCNNPPCVNPAHLELVTPKEHLERSVSRRASCRRGHAYTTENTYVDPQGKRRCNTCRRDTQRHRRKENNQ